MCPGSHQYSNNGKFATFGQPRCGDGSNFAFYLTRPEQPQEEEKILIELSGGGACWDKTTCTLQSSLLKMPPFDFMLGMSCSDMGKIAQASEGWDILCARTVGQTDFTEYTTVVLPYCTQDVHLGDAEATYDETNVKHVGAHNTYRTLQWVFDNFEDPSHIVLTGCSAGATPLPVLYHMINEHYKARGRNVEIDIIADSPVYLSPSKFLENYFHSWNHETVMKWIGFDYDTYKKDVEYPNKLLDYVLDSSEDNDSFGYVSHKNDPISIMYFSAMLGGESGVDIVGDMEGEATDNSTLGLSTPTSVQTEWWRQMNNSWSQAMNEHENFDVFIMDGSGHCSTGLYFPTQKTGFETWVANLIDETNSTTLPTTVQQNTVTNASVTTTTDATATAEAYEPEPSDKPVLPNSNSFPSFASVTDAPSTATTTASAGYTFITTMLFFQFALFWFG